MVPRRPSSLPPFEDALTRLDLGADTSTRSFSETFGRRVGRDGTGDSPRLPTLTLASAVDAGRATTDADADLEVAGILGRGGMGDVWLARQRSLGREVAVKTLATGAASSAGDALVAEGRIIGRLEHPSIVPVHALGRTASGQPVLVMKRIEGVAWRDLLHAPDHPHWSHFGTDEPLVVHVQILMQVCQALGLAHERGVVHRDIKPANVMVGAFGEVYLVDWGLAVEMGHERGESRRLEGTPAYMAPEMIAGLPVDARTDVFLLGATLHEVITGAPPHAGQSLMEVLERAYRPTAADYGDAPGELTALCREAMHRDPARRPASARDVRDRLAAFLAHRSSVAIVRRGRALLQSLEVAGTPHATRRAVLDECQVTLRLALAEWPESPSALAALDDWRRRAVAIEAEGGNLDAARHLLAQITDPPAELRAEVENLERRLAREQRQADLGRRAAFDRDVTIGARERRLFGVILMVAIALMATVAVPASVRGTLDAREILLFSIVPTVSFVCVVTLLRRRLLGNVYARRTVAVLGVLFVLIVAHRFVAWLAGRPPEQTLVAELLTVAGVCGVAGMMLARWWFIGAATGLLGALLGTWNPALAGPTFTAVALIIALAGVVSWSRDVPRPPSVASP